MITRTAALVAGAGLSAIVLVGCAQSRDLMSPSPYFGVDNHGKRYVPKELHEKRYLTPPSEEPAPDHPWSE